MHMRKFFYLLAGMLLLFSNISLAKQEVTGKVTDETGAPIPNATISIKKTRTGTSASFDGTFKINAAPNAVLVISAVGYESKEVNVSNETNIGVKLVVDTRAMSEVVVTGTGTATSKRKLGISVESLSGGKLPSIPTATLDQALIGKIPGAQV